MFADPQENDHHIHFLDNISENPPSSESVDKNDRIEQTWDQRSETLIANWGQSAKKESKKHYAISNKKKTLFYIFGLSAALIPMAIGITEQFMPSYIKTIVLLTAGTISTVMTFFDFGGARQKHLASEQLNKVFYIDVEHVLSKPKRFRNACDVTIERLKQEYIRIMGLCETI